jgi:hypothetical protein
MADPAEIERELREYLEKEPHMWQSDKLPYLMLIINKHFGLDKMDHIIDYHDLDMIISDAKGVYSQTVMPMSISKKELTPSQTNYALVLEAFVGYLNKHKLIKRLIKFNHTEKK